MTDSNEENQKWLRERVEKGIFTARYNRERVSSNQLAEIVNAIEPEISKESESFIFADQGFWLLILVRHLCCKKCWKPRLENKNNDS